MLKLAGMDDTALLGFLAKRHKEVFAAIAATPEFELKGDYTPELLVPVVQTITSLSATGTQEGVKKAAAALVTQFEAMGEEASPADTLLKSLEGIQAELKKRGARNSADDSALLQTAHDTICKLGAACATPPAPSPHAMDGKPVVALPPGSSATKADGTHKDGDVMDPLNKDAITSEGNKRGAAVTSPALPAESDNGVNNAEAPDPEAVGAVKAKSKPSWMDDMAGDDTETKATKAKARAMFGKAQVIEVTQAQLDALVAKTVADALAKAALPAALEVPVIPRVAPALLQVGKGGDTQKMVSVADQIGALKKSVSPHAADEARIFKRNEGEDNDTCTVIKAIHANRIYVPANELQSLGLIAR